MISTMFWSVLIRTGQLLVESSTTIFCGLLVAGIMQRMMGTEGIRRLFGNTGWKGLLRAWGVGMLLPVCSLGVIPIARQMLRSGVSSGTVLAFVLAAPHINPLSLLYGVTLSDPIVILCFGVASLILAISAGFIWEYYFQNDDSGAAIQEIQPSPPGLGRLVSVLVCAARESINPAMFCVYIALVFTGLVSGLLPHGILGLSMRHTDWVSPLLMGVLAIPFYTGPLQGMMRLGLMFEHGNSVGAAFVLFELGIGINLGLILWMGWLFGFKKIALFFIGLATCTILIGYGMEQPLYFAQEEASHTHAFDDWTSPFVFDQSVSTDQIVPKITQKIEILEPVALAGWVLLVFVGICLRLFDVSGKFENWLQREKSPVQSQPASVWNKKVSGQVLGLVTLLGLVVFSMVALFLYYPGPGEAMAEIIRVRADAVVAVRSGKKEEAIRQLEKWDLLSRKLQIGYFLRTGIYAPEAAKAIEELRECMEEIRDALLANETQKAKDLVGPLEKAFRESRVFFEKDHKEFKSSSQE